MKRALLPISIVALGLSLLIGCFYVPTFERPASSTQKDFRKLVGTDIGRALRTGYANRTMVLQLLGPPQLASADGSSIGYLFTTRQGYWIWPLCFGAATADRKAYGLRLEFGSDDVLRQFKMASDDLGDGTINGRDIFPLGTVIDRLNESGAPLRWSGTGREVDFEMNR